MPAPINGNISPLDPNAARAEAAAPSQDVGQEEFLHLLMTQLSNQDPLNPMDSAKFMEQIAQLNSVQQLMDLNNGVDQLMLGLTSLNNQSAVDLVGKTVVARGDAIAYDGTGAPQELHYELGAPAEVVTVNVRNEAGDIVDTKTIEQTTTAGEHSWTWTPPADVPGGDYTFEVIAKDAIGEGANDVPSQTFVVGTVDELRFDSGMPVLLVGDNEITLDGILRVLDGSTSEPETPELPFLDSTPGHYGS